MCENCESKCYCKNKKEYFINELKKLGFKVPIWRPIEEAPLNEEIFVYCEHNASIYKDIIKTDIESFKKEKNVTHYMELVFPRDQNK